ncbi:MAG: flagellar motor switch protein FliN [Deltaproteobacteria bacterium]|jgi:flagellar motor switch protein FliN/FliY|nr:flagellar motor switch protein FliN [Deltaproteobacteria bacterium]
MEQNEIDALMKEMEEGEGEASATFPTDEENLGWDDVQEELEASRKEEPVTEVASVGFGELQPGDAPKANMDIDFILDIPLTLTVELGRSKMLISELLQLGQGSVVELTKLAGEPMDIFINQRLIARGEVVVVNEKFGVRLTDIISPAERVNRLR